MEFREEASQNVSRIGSEIERLRNDYCDTGILGSRSHYRYHDFWTKAREISEMFKTLRPLFREDREHLWSDYSSICNEVKTKQNEGRDEAKRNREQLEHEIDNLRNNYCDSDLIGYRSHYRYHDFWAKAKEMSEMFKVLKPLFKVDREQLWANYRSICDEVKGKQNEDRAESQKNRGIIESLITDAHHQAGGASSKEELDKAKDMQSYNLNLLKERKLFKDDKDFLWKYWKDTNEKIFWKRRELQESGFLHGKEYVSRAVNAVHSGDPYEAIIEIKGAQKNMQGLYMNKEKRNELYDSLNDAWEKASSRIGEIKGEKRKKHEEWRGHMEDNIERWENSIQKSEGYISSLEDQIGRLREQEANARTDEFAEMVRGWISEKEEKISEVRGQIRELEGKKDSVRSRMNR